MGKAITWSRGSEWHRWDPHLHVPGTLLNDQFGSNWERFLTAIEKANPRCEAVGITDYCVTRGYEEFLRHWKEGRAKNVKFVFPNIEFRLDVETEKKKAINLHLLFSPEDKDHIRQIQRVLAEFSFEFRGKKYHCTDADLIELGKAYEPSQTSDQGALRVGVNQFKLSISDLRQAIQSNAWAGGNCLVAVAASRADGTAGLQHDASFTALREEIESLAHFVFSGNPKDREYWLGQSPSATREYVERTYGSLKPCLHGCDAHRLTDVLSPAESRFCWIRSELSFSGLKQVVLEPELRVSIGSQPPPGPTPDECIKLLSVVNAPWLGTKSVEVNDGLVAIIGPRGSGKTALADMIARSAGATIQGESSFLLKARDHLGTASGQLVWGDGSDAARPLIEQASNVADLDPRVRYLSQQFVDRLCSSVSIGQELLDEIEAVVFQAIPDENRFGATSFRELRELRLDQVTRLRSQYLTTIQQLSDAISAEDEKRAKIPTQEKRLRTLNAKITSDEKELKALLPKQKKKESETLSLVQGLITDRTRQIQDLRLKVKRLRELEKEFQHFQANTMQEFETLKERYEICGLSESEWKELLPVFSAKVSEVIEISVKKNETEQVRILKGPAGYTRDEDDLKTWSLEDLKELQVSLNREIGVEKERARKHGELLRRVGILRQEQGKVNRELEYLSQAGSRRTRAIANRRKAYAKVFESYVQEQEVLEELYAPLKARLAVEGEVERKLEFFVRRQVDVDAWVRMGESLLDLRKTGPFQGRGRLKEIVLEKLTSHWRTGGAVEVAEAMEGFIKDYMPELLKMKLPDVDIQDFGRWLFSTEHVSLEYGIKYEGIEVARLSPGMRGIVLLILYLAIDQWDTRPLLIDQPEENLDPQSVYDELVRYFRSAKRRRQVILVTHNPNLVVNADADQVIVASAERKTSFGLPNISYRAGGLEDNKIRADVCRILEGGERAFLERERRYGLPRDFRTT